jgi:hypothetical protein
MAIFEAEKFASKDDRSWNVRQRVQRQRLM